MWALTESCSRRLLGVDVKAKISIARNATYTSDKTIQEMIFIMSEVIENSILEEMKESDHFALMFDETMDCTVTEQLAIHGRFINKSTEELKSHYLSPLNTEFFSLEITFSLNMPLTHRISISVKALTPKLSPTPLPALASRHVTLTTPPH